MRAEITQRAGYLSAAAAYFAWGFLPLYFHALRFADAREILSQRILWCVPSAFAAMLLLAGFGPAMRELRLALQPRMIKTLALSAVFIFINWGLYLWLVLQSRVLEASLAYFLAPLVAVAMGVVFFKERLSRAQAIALVFATIGVVLQGVAMGAPPWASLILCATWSAYSFIRKRAEVGSATGLLIESLILLPVALGLMIWAAQDAPLHFGESAGNSLLLALAGPITALPLMLFAFGARRISFAALGMVQFLAPSIQFALGILFGERFHPLSRIAFALIWTGLGFFCWDMWKRYKAFSVETAATSA